MCSKGAMHKTYLLKSRWFSRSSNLVCLIASSPAYVCSSWARGPLIRAAIAVRPSRLLSLQRALVQWK